MSGAQTDEELMVAYAAEGSPAAFTELYQRYESRLYSYFLRRLSNEKRPLAADLFQKTWLKIHSARKSFDAKQSFSPWLFSIALNTLRDEWRSKGQLATAEEFAQLEDVAASDDLDRELDLRSEFSRFEGALSKLPEAQREALILAEWEGLTSKEVAEALGVSEVAARQAVSRARRKVRELMKGEQD